MDSAHDFSTVTMPSSQQNCPINPLSASPELALCFQILGGQSFLIFATLPHRDTHYLSLAEEDNVLRHIQAIGDSVPHFDKHERWIYRAFSKFVAGTAGVQQVILSSPSTDCSCSRVHLVDFEYHWLLTEMLNNPYNVDARNLWADNTAWNSDTLGSKERVITLHRVLDKGKVARMLLVMLLISPILGVLVGHCADSAEAGLAVSAGIFALASFIQGLVAWTLG